VAVLLFESPRQDAIASYVNFAMHPDTVGGLEFLGGLSGVLSRRLLGEYKGTNMVTVFANGACGNINHVDVHWAGVAKRPHRNRAARHGAGWGCLQGLHTFAKVGRGRVASAVGNGEASVAGVEARRGSSAARTLVARVGGNELTEVPRTGERLQSPGCGRARKASRRRSKCKSSRWATNSHG
jgi:hypothetical protein